MAVHLAVVGDVSDGVLFCAVLEMSCMRSGTELGQFLRIFCTYFFKEKLLYYMTPLVFSG